MTAVANPIGVEHGLTYVITGPDGTRAVLNDPTDPDFVGYITPRDGGGITGLEGAGVREVSDLLPEADGGVHGAFLQDRLSFTIGGSVLPDATVGGSWVQRQAKLLLATKALTADATLAWTPSEAPPVQVSFRSAQPTRVTGARPKKFLVAGVCERSVVVSQALNVAALSPSGAVGGGFSSPATSPLGSSATAVGALVVTNAGTGKAWPELTIIGPCANPSIIHQASGLGIFLNYTLTAGESLVIDTDPRKRTVKLGGTANRYSAVDSRTVFWPLLSGANTLQLGFSSYSAPASLEVRWRDTWG